ncbi:MAG: hypothetical protein HC881_16500 [Leptolyngbyaceae cyanobacterium SL_7_1]|nr:hypothetical protein [Leptolyngbyaceae cyanobacterium SL_7_1]
MAFRSGVLSLKDTITKSVHSVLSGRGGIAATIQTFIVKVLIIAINMGTGVITARFLGPAGRGELTAMLVWPQLLAFTLTLGLPKSIIYNFKKHPEEKPRLFSAALIMSAGLGVLASMIGVGLIPYVLTKYPPEVIRSAQWLMVMSPLTLLGLICSSSLEAESDFTAANQLRYFVPLSTLALLGGLILTTGVTSFNAALAYTLPSIPITLWILVRLWRRYRPQWKN